MQQQQHIQAKQLQVASAIIASTFPIVMGIFLDGGGIGASDASITIKSTFVYFNVLSFCWI